MAQPPGSGDGKTGFEDDVRELAGLYFEARRADLARLDAALAANDLAAVRAVGHAFRGSSAPFGFPEAGRLGAELEEAAARGDRAAVDRLVPLLRAALPATDPGRG
jgi:HPt (histidine-containing phosphotransfer) domain-containing protein